MDVSDRDGADRSGHHLRRLAAPVEDDERRSELDEDQPRPDAPRSEDDGVVGRTDYQGQHRRRDLRDDFHGRALRARRERHLDGIRRRLRAGDPRRREKLEERHPEGSRRLRAHQPHRGVAVSRRHGVRGGESLSAGRLQAVRLSERRFRRDVDEDRQRRAGQRIRARHSRRHQGRQAVVSGHRALHLHLVRRRSELAIAEAEPARHSGT